MFQGAKTISKTGEPPRMWSPRHPFWFVAAVALAAVLRLAALDRYPEPVNEDELSNIYDGWSLAETGAERAGRRWPILCRGWGPGDNRPALMAWLCAGVSAFTGFSVGGCRAVSGVVGTVTVALVGWWGVRVVGRRAALLGMLILAVSPWHVLYSRLAHEGTALPGLFAVAIILLLRWAVVDDAGTTHRSWRWAVAGLVIGLSTNAYGATRLTGLLFAALGAAMAIAWSRLGVQASGESACETPEGIPAKRDARRDSRTSGSRLRSTLTAVGGIAIGALIGAAPQIWAMGTDYDAFVGRARMTGIAFFGWLDAVETIAAGVVANLSPRYLFYSFGEADRLAAGRCSVVELPLFYAGLLWMCVPRNGIRWFDRLLLIGGLLICVCPPAFTRASVHSLRASGCAVLIPMVSAVGLVAWGRLGARAIAVFSRGWPEGIPATKGARPLTSLRDVKGRRDSRTSGRPLPYGRGSDSGGHGDGPRACARGSETRRGPAVDVAAGDVAAAVCAVVILLAGAWYVGRFTGDAYLRSVFHQPHMVSLGRWLAPRMDDYDRVYVVTQGNQPDIYLAAFTGMTPREFQSAERPVWGERNEYAHRLNRFHIARFLKDVYDQRRAADVGERWLIVDAHRTMVRELGPPRVR